MFQLTIISVLLFFHLYSNAQSDAPKNNDNTGKVKKGFSLGAIPIFSFDSDVGLKYGVLANFYDYGDGSTYPLYDHSLFAKWFQTTKGSSIVEVKYDSDKLLNNYRLTISTAYQTERTLDFYGFNGYQAYYNPDFENPDHPNYISKVFYRYERKIFRINADIQKKLNVNGLKCLLGLGYFQTMIGKVDINKLNQGMNNMDVLPETDGLFDLYKIWEVFPDSEINGGENVMTKAGFVYNSCDNEADPNKGLWSEMLFLLIQGTNDVKGTSARISLQHRQYLSIIPQRLKLAYRIGYQTDLFGKTPFYLLPFLIDSRNTFDAFGGAKTLRGILRNRVVGNGVAYGNFEFRAKTFETVVFNQNFYIALNTFIDAARVVDPYQPNLSNVPSKYQKWFSNEDENWHFSYGAGIRFILNQNFIVAVDYGMATRKYDGTNGIYVGMDYLF